MNKELFVLSPNDKVSKAIEMFKEHNIHHIPLVSGSSLMGMVSNQDVLWLKKIELEENTKLKQFMTKVILVCHEDTPLDHLAHVFVKEQISGMPVVDDNQVLTGMVTHHDILKWVYDR